MSELSPKDRVLNLLNGEEVDRIPVFTGMGAVLLEAMDQYGMKFSRIHQDALDMAKLSASTYKLYGLESVVAPYDVCMEAEILGAELNFYEKSTERILYPTIREKSIETVDDIVIPDDFEELGRVKMLREVIRLLKEDVGDEVAIGSYVLGPFTLAGQVMDLDGFLKNSVKKPEETSMILERLSEVVIRYAETLKSMGVDYITLREMGAPADVISPRVFNKIVMPHLKEAIKGIEEPNILHICGNTNPLFRGMSECGATAISVEKKADVRKMREELGENALIFGNIDGFGLLVKGTVDDVRTDVIKAIEDGVNGIMPGCDIWPTAKGENIKAMVGAVKDYFT